MNDPIVIVGAARTPMGAFQGDFSSISAVELGAVAIRAAIERAGIAADQVNEVLFGNCLMAGLGPGAGAAGGIKAGVPVSAGAVTMSQDVRFGHEGHDVRIRFLVAGTNEVVVAGGMESMTNAPYLVPKARGGYRMGHGNDLRPHDARRSAKTPTKRAARWAPSARSARPNTISRAKQQDAFAIESVKRAQAATARGAFKWEIAPVTVRAAAASRDRQGRRPAESEARQDSDAEAGVQEETAPSPPPRPRRSTTAPQRWW